MYNLLIRVMSCFIVDQRKRLDFREKYFHKKKRNYLADAVFSLILAGTDSSVNDFKIAEIFKESCMVFDLKQISANLQYLFSKPLLNYKKAKMPKYVLVWGSHHNSSQPEMAVEALAKQIPLIRMEDGFLRSADTWCNTNVDRRYTDGISFTFSNDVHYFDATRSSLMERLLNDRNLTFSSQQLERARKCINFITKNYLTKYNHQPIYAPIIGDKTRPKVLVVDQSYGDFSISKGLANDNTFKEMLDAA